MGQRSLTAVVRRHRALCYSRSRRSRNARIDFSPNKSPSQSFTNRWHCPVTHEGIYDKFSWQRQPLDVILIITGNLLVIGTVYQIANPLVFGSLRGRSLRENQKWSEGVADFLGPDLGVSTSGQLDGAQPIP